ncbi:MAG: hypothetical protein KBH93_01260 [Anaerolineae bacterium]|nr:hypothetical protein [Anaerolineae bacterium]
MGVKNPKNLVIDADIARSAGGKGAVAPVPIQCRSFLDEVRKTGHKMVITPDISTEWKKHASRYSQTWRVSMQSRGQIISVGYNDRIENEVLRGEIREYSPDPNGCEAMLKDVHLIEAALATHRIISSRDERARRLFGEISKPISLIRQIVWVNPTVEAKDCISWLGRGAPADRERQLGCRWDS